VKRERAWFVQVTLRNDGRDSNALVQDTYDILPKQIIRHMSTTDTATANFIVYGETPFGSNQCRAIIGTRQGRHRRYGAVESVGTRVT
jgi:hypothetical protein